MTQEVERGDSLPDRQLTLRAALTGMVLGGVLCLSNLYVVLKTGWSLGVTITATIVAFAFFSALKRAGLISRPFSVLENNAVASIASSGGWMTGGGNMAALPALLLLTGQRPAGLAMFAWFALIASLGVFVAIPLKRQFIDVEKLPFPMSVATAEALKAMHASLPLPRGAEPLGATALGGKEGRGEGRTLAGSPAKLLLRAGLVASLFTLWRDTHLAWSIPGRLTLAGWLGFDVSVVLAGGGSLMKPRTAFSLLLGAVLTWGVLVPLLLTSGEFKTAVQFTLWPAAALLASSALTGLALQWRMLGRGLDELRLVLRQRAAPSKTEAPTWWFFAGFAVLAPPLVGLMWWLFGVPLWAGALAMPLALLVGVISARVTGETDVTPTKAMGPLTQLVAGVALPANVTANVMSANVTAGVGLHAADLLSDLKTGWVLGADPRKQVYAQFLGLLVGAAVVVPAFNLLVPDASVLGSEQFPAPAVMVWAGVSKVLALGVTGLPAFAKEAMGLAALLGVALVLLEARVKEPRKKWIPSASALGIAMVLPAATALTMVAGALLGMFARRRWTEASLTPVASGLIAGESVTGVVMALIRVLT